MTGLLLGLALALAVALLALWAMDRQRAEFAVLLRAERRDNNALIDELNRRPR